MAGFNQTIVTPASTDRGMGTSSTKTMHGMFPKSPIYLEEITDTKVTSKNGGSYIELLQDGEVDNSGGYYGFAVGNFDRDFTDAPNIPADVLVGAGGKPGTAYVPNPVMPGPGNVDPLQQPAPPDGPAWPAGPSDPFPGAGGGYETNPKATSANIASITMGHYGLGTSGA
jgi:hypothetical protein